MTQYRKKPVVIDAWPVSELIRSASSKWSNLPAPVAEAYERGEVIFCPDKIFVRTLEGSMEAAPSDMVIRGVKGELYPCKADIFALTYEAAPTAAPSGAVAPVMNTQAGGEALTDAQIEALVRSHGTGGWQTLSDMHKFARAVLAASRAVQAEPADVLDAKRYRWLRLQDWFDGPLCVVRNPKLVFSRESSLRADCPSRDRLDAAIDAMIAAAPTTPTKG